jgi:hypothetical protein
MGRLCVAQRAKAGAAEIALEEWRHALQRAGAPEYPVSEAGDSGIRVAEGARYQRFAGIASRILTTSGFTCLINTKRRIEKHG